MRTSSALTFLLFCLSLSPAYGKTVAVSGMGNGYQGVEMRLYIQSDEVTEDLIPLQRVRCDQTGRFLFETDIEKKEKLVLSAGIYHIFLYVMPGSSYQLILPDLVQKSDEERENAFFIPVSVMPVIADNQADINNLIRNFDMKFNPLFNLVADRVVYKTRRDEIPALIGELNSLSQADQSAEYRDFVTFRMMMLNLVARGEFPGRMEDSILINNRFLSDNPAYIDLVRQLFGRHFALLASGDRRDQYLRATEAGSVTSLRRIVISAGKVSNEQLCDFIILLNLYSSLSDGSLSRPAVGGMLDSLAIKGSSGYIRDLASAVRKSINKIVARSVPPTFSLTAADGTARTPGSFRGRYLLLSFGRADNPFSVSEFGILNSWIGRYSGKLDAVTILRDEEFGPAVRRMESLGFRWLFLDGSAGDLLEYNYGVKLYPSFVLIGPDGRVIVDECPYPSENLDVAVGKILRESK